LLASVLACAACGGSLPGPARVAHPPSSYQEVPYPPPAALVEVVSDAPAQDAVWLDGHWVWRGRYYLWRRGGWVAAAPELGYATWHCVVAKDGRLLFAPGTWYDASRRGVSPPPTLVPARAPPNEVTLETEAPR
jgi:hypothetical protein